jgi:hypothetical protein
VIVPQTEQVPRYIGPGRLLVGVVVEHFVVELAYWIVA